MVGHSAGGYTALLIAGAVPNFVLAKAYRLAVASVPYRKRADAAGTHRRKPDLKYVADPRVRAIFVMAPALGYAFDQSALVKVRIPVRLYRPAADEMLPHPWNAERIAQFLSIRPEYVVLDGAGHFVFLAPARGSLMACEANLHRPGGYRPHGTSSAIERGNGHFFPRVFGAR